MLITGDAVWATQKVMFLEQAPLAARRRYVVFAVGF